MFKITTRCLAAVLMAMPATALLAHHSLAAYDTTTPVRVKGTILQVHLINPHSILYLEGRDETGAVVRWAVEGPSVLQLTRKGFAKDALKAGDVVEVCGYLPKERVVWQVASPDGTASLAGRLLNGETMTMADGRQESWGDYGVHKCFGPEFRDQHSRP
jgi:hypothetical protein